jgi:hypothetical protein
MVGAVTVGVIVVVDPPDVYLTEVKATAEVVVDVTPLVETSEYEISTF